MKNLQNIMRMYLYHLLNDELSLVHICMPIVLSITIYINQKHLLHRIRYLEDVILQIRKFDYKKIAQEIADNKIGDF